MRRPRLAARLLAGALAALAGSCAIDFDRHFQPVGVDAGSEGDCGDGLDGDGDGLVDCADPDCGGFSCAAPAPAGWSGPVVAAVGAGAECPPSTGPRLTGGACTCACTGQLGCGAVELTLYQDDCAQTPDATLAPTAGCSTADVGGGVNRAKAVVASTGSCTAQTQSTEVRLCTGHALGCAQGGACLPTGGPAACVYRQGEDACPAEYPTLLARLSPSATSTTCDSCTCGPDAACSATLSGFDADSCQGAGGVAIPADGSCVSLSGGLKSVSTTLGATAPQCIATGGGLPSGGGPVYTVCCSG